MVKEDIIITDNYDAAIDKYNMHMSKINSIILADTMIHKLYYWVQLI
jgi:hypothetical protein